MTMPNVGTRGPAPANPGVIASADIPANPLRDPRDRRIPRVAGPCVMVMFGVTGDLARKKLMPALYDLANRGLLPPGFSFVGFARRDWADEDFAQITYDAVKEHARTPFRETVWQQMSEGIRFVSGEFTDNEAFDKLAGTVRQLDHERGTGGNYAFYLSIPPKFFPVVVEQLKRSGLADPGPADAVPGRGVEPAQRGRQVRLRVVQRRRGVRPAGRDRHATRRGAGHRRELRVLPVDPAGPVPRRGAAAQAQRPVRPG